MILQRISRYMRDHDWFAVIVEVLVVMVGLMMAFQLDRWWEQRGEHAQEQNYVNRLIADVQADIELIEYGISLAEVRQDFAELLMKVTSAPEAAAAEPVRFLAAVAQAAFTYTPSLTSHTFEDLRSTGNMSLLRNREIKDSLYDYYGFDEGQRQFMSLNFMIEFKYFELSAGVLSNEQYTFVQDNWFVVTPNDLDRVAETPVDEVAVKSAVDRFLANNELLAWIPRVRGVQRELILMHGIRLSRARDLLEILESYSTSPREQTGGE